LPTEYKAWPQLTDFNVDDNQITGTLPTEYGAWSQLQGFQVYINSLTGTLPTEYAAAWPAPSDGISGFYAFDVSHNSGLSGTFPTQWRSETSGTFAYCTYAGTLITPDSPPEQCSSTLNSLA